MSDAAPPDEIRVALIGYGLAGRIFHGRLLAATTGVRVAAIVTSNARRQAEARLDFPGATVHTSVEHLWASADAFDLVVVATSTPSHAALATAAIDAGKHVVVEKPVTATAAGARALAERAAARGVHLVPFLNRRWDSDHLTVQRLLSEGALGTVLRYESRFDRWRPQARAGAWREVLPPTEGGGVLLDLGPHLVDQALLLHGAVTAVNAEVFARRGGADDDVFIALRHASGVTSHLWANALAAAPGPRLRVLGSEAAYVVDGLDGQEDALRAGRRPGEAGFGEEPREHWGRLLRGDDGVAVVPETGGWLRFYTTLAACLRGEAPPPVTAEDAIAGLEVLDAARTSAETGAVIRLSPGEAGSDHG
ncbi:MAG TPA: Gfo/Idh/MocA family oxidoreductase [Candidatus Deferrimicrobium sp.]|nr:Gfo/Idh/MocA family oxidoreductase [Candidatus Deferrimicrobium sp.]